MFAFADSTFTAFLKLPRTAYNLLHVIDNLPITAAATIEEEFQPTDRPAGPCVMVIFGAAGDLTKRKLVPALYNLAKEKLLSANFAVVGVSVDDLSAESFRDQVLQFLDKDKEDRHSKSWTWFRERLHYERGDFGKAETFTTLRDRLSQVDTEYGTQGNYLFYLATAPKFFAQIVQQLGACGLGGEGDGHWRRVIIEKPFGHDLESAKALNAQIQSALQEDQIYRIDHYLGKETVQNLLVFRFSNSIFEPLWNGRYVDHVQITNAETVGVERRGGYFDNVGTMRDMVPNHVMQLISLTAMEPPGSFRSEAVRDEQAKVLHAMQPFEPDDVLQNTVRGQYGDGLVDGVTVPAYRKEPGVSPESRTETFVAMKLSIDNWRWAGVPFYVRTGKRLAERHTEIVIQFKRTPIPLFQDSPGHKARTNQLVIQIQPEEGMSLSFGAKIPGSTVRVGSVDMSCEYAEYFKSEPKTGYEILLYDCMIGDTTLFQRADMVEAGWSVVDPVLDVWRAIPARKFPNYDAGTWGPKESDELLARDGRVWRTIKS
ncbi:MAG TPA: glucose-6-phosphate dehydrogenase [Terriglobales bacterium]|nr:glucose-6-phosphate dehydrogenase [Terriglobales bacterium]